ncbi:MAG: hypothetical protein IKO74_11715 [Selenomonadaceae bacterium]|nr:hypothetical protein [Selenomonadaceae bacterium]
MILFISIFAGLSVFIFLMILVQKMKHAEPYPKPVDIFGKRGRSVNRAEKIF